MNDKNTELKIGNFKVFLFFFFFTFGYKSFRIFISPYLKWKGCHIDRHILSPFLSKIILDLCSPARLCTLFPASAVESPLLSWPVWDLQKQCSSHLCLFGPERYQLNSVYTVVTVPMKLLQLLLSVN